MVCSVVQSPITGTYPAFVAETIPDAAVALKAGIQTVAIAIRENNNELGSGCCMTIYRTFVQSCHSRNISTIHRSLPVVGNHNVVHPGMLIHASTSRCNTTPIEFSLDRSSTGTPAADHLMKQRHAHQTQRLREAQPRQSHSQLGLESAAGNRVRLGACLTRALLAARNREFLTRSVRKFG